MATAEFSKIGWKATDNKENKLLESYKCHGIFFFLNQQVKKVSRDLAGLQSNMLDTEREIFEQILEEIWECIHEYT